MHDILGVTAEGRKELYLHLGFPLTYINCIFIENDKDIKAWLLLNPVLKDPLDLLVYCYRQYTADRVAPRPLRRDNYLPENVISNWAWQAGARTGIQAPRKEVRPDPGPANAEDNQANDSRLFLLVSSSSSSDGSDAGEEGCEAIIGTSPSPVVDLTESGYFRIPLAIQSPSKINTHDGWDLRGCEDETLDGKVGKRGPPSDSECWEHLNKKFRQASYLREWLTATEDLKYQARFDDEKDDEDTSPGKRLQLTLSAECGGSECGRSDGALFVC